VRSALPDLACLGGLCRFVGRAWARSRSLSSFEISLFCGFVLTLLLTTGSGGFSPVGCFLSRPQARNFSSASDRDCRRRDLGHRLDASTSWCACDSAEILLQFGGALRLIVHVHTSEITTEKNIVEQSFLGGGLSRIGGRGCYFRSKKPHFSCQSASF